MNDQKNMLGIEKRWTQLQCRVLKLRDRLDSLSAAAGRWVLVPKIDRSLLAFFLAFTFFWMWLELHGLLGNSFSPDSYAFFLLGQNIFDGLGFSSFSLRDFYIDVAWPIPSRSFPPLYPLLVGLTDFVFSSRIQSGVGLNLFLLFATLFTFAFLSRSLSKSHWFFLSLSFLLFFDLNKPYQYELGAARSIPLMILLYLLFLFFFLKSLEEEAGTRKNTILCSASLCALLLSRFDQMPFCLAVLAMTPFIYRVKGTQFNRGIKKGATIAIVFVLLYLPWGVRNTVQFGTPWASDNAITAKSTHESIVQMTYWKKGEYPPSLFEEPKVWLKQRISYLKRNWKKFNKSTHHIVYYVPLLVLAFWATFTTSQRLVLFLGLLNALFTFAAISLTPYGDLRYFSLVHLNLILALGLCVTNLLKVTSGRLSMFVAGVTIVVCLVTLPFHDRELRSKASDLFSGRFIAHDVDRKQRFYDKLVSHMEQHLSSNTLLAVPRPEEWTYFTKSRTTWLPRNGSQTEHLVAWLKKFEVDFLVLGKKEEQALKLTSVAIDENQGVRLLDAKQVIADHD